MQTICRVLVVFFSIFLFLSKYSNLVFAETVVSVKVGIEVKPKKGNSFPAKAIDQIKVGDELQVHVIPQRECYLYVIYSDQRESVLLKSGVASENIELVLPAVNQSYQLEKMLEQQEITIICDIEERKEIAKVFQSGKTKFSVWRPLEEKLVKENKKVFLTSTSKNERFGGDSRAFGFRPPWSTKLLPTISGKSYLIKRYRFHVEK